MVMMASVGVSNLVILPTYSEPAPVNTVATTTEQMAQDVQVLNAGSTKPSYLVARPGESQEIIDAIISQFPEEPLMVQVARCESKLDPKADRITSDGRTGVDGGLFQINQVHLPKLDELGLDRYDLEDNLTFARILYDESGLQPWSWSRHCWG